MFTNKRRQEERTGKYGTPRVQYLQVNYALGALYFICEPSNKHEILKPEVVAVIKGYATAGAVNVSFSNLAQAFLDKNVIRSF